MVNELHKLDKACHYITRVEKQNDNIRYLSIILLHHALYSIIKDGYIIVAGFNIFITETHKQAFLWL